MFLLYQWDLTGQPLASLYEGDVDPWARELAETVAARAPELDARIDEAATGWAPGPLAPGAGRPDRRGGDRLARRPARRGRAQRPENRDPRAHNSLGADGRRDRRGRAS